MISPYPLIDFKSFLSVAVPNISDFSIHIDVPSDERMLAPLGDRLGPDLHGSLVSKRPTLPAEL